MFPKKGKVNLYGAGTPAGSTTVAGAHRALASFVQARRREETGGRERAHRGGHIFHLQCIFPTPPPSPQNSSQVSGRNFSKTRCVLTGSLEQIKGSTCWAAETIACSHVSLICKPVTLPGDSPWAQVEVCSSWSSFVPLCVAEKVLHVWEPEHLTRTKAPRNSSIRATPPVAAETDLRPSVQGKVYHRKP